MAHVVFLRAANVGGHNVFRPTELVKALSHLDVVNVGAAGTFVVRKKTTTDEIRTEILRRLKFEPAIAIRPASEITKLIRLDPFKGIEFSKNLRGWVCTFTGRPKTKPKLPLMMPNADRWSVRFDRVEGPFAFGLFQRQPGGFVIPANVVEKAVGVPGTVRWWETFVRIANVIG